MIPAFPVGATIGSLHVAAVTIGRFASLSHSIPEIYGIRTDVANKFGLLADAFASSVLDGSVTGVDLIRRHTAFPIYTSLLVRESTERWLQAQLSGEPNAWSRYFPGRVHGEVLAEHPRLCPACVAEDHAKFGLAYWRVQHQMPSIKMCERHGGVLHDRCAECGAHFPTGTRSGLPGEPCRACGKQQTAEIAKVKVSSGSRGYAALIARAAVGAAPELSPEARSRLLQQAFDGQGADACLKRLLSSWGVKTVSALERALSCKLQERALHRMLATGAAQVPFSVIVALVAFAVSELGSEAAQKILTDVKERELAVRRVVRESRAETDLATALEVEARRLALPSAVVEALLQDDAARASTMVGTINVVSMIDRLPDEHRALLEGVVT